MRDRINDEYFEWLYTLVCGGRFVKQYPYRKLLTRLHSTEFTYVIPRDRNRADDGVGLRYRFSLIQGYEDSYDLIMECLDGPCSVLEMMVALAIRCEENIMDDPTMGDRTKQWFWNMIVNLGLGSMLDDHFDRQFVDSTIDRFLNREYDRDGKGGLFRIRNNNRDLRKVEIWYQLCWYLDSITDTDI